MADFIRVDMGGGTEVLFEAMESDLVSTHGGEADVRELEEATNRVEDIAVAAQQLTTSLREKMTPDEITLEIGVGLSGEVGWFFAKSTANASLKVTVTWNSSNKR